MASRYYGANKGDRRYPTPISGSGVTEDSSTTSKKVELVVDLAAGYTREEVLDAIDYIKDKIISGNWPPA